MKETLTELNEKYKLTKLFQEHLGLIFRVGITITIIVIWVNLGEVRTGCISTIMGTNPYYEITENELRCQELLREEKIYRDFFVDTLPLVIFLGVSYLLHWFFKKR